MVKNVNDFNTNNTSDLVKKADYGTNIGEIENKIKHHVHSNKYITNQEFNKLTSENFAKYLASIIDDSVITCDEIIETAKADSTNFKEKK